MQRCNGTWLPGCLMAMLVPALSLVQARATLAQDAVKAYLYGYPIVLMEQTRNELFCAYNVSSNEFIHAQEFPDDTFTDIVRPNVDTLYSSAYLDLSQGPVVLTIPPLDGRYQLVALLDAWSNNFVGSSSLDDLGRDPSAHMHSGMDSGMYGGGGGDAGKTFVITLEGWEGEEPEVPAGAARVTSPTPLTWLLIRTELIDEADVPNVLAIQDAMVLDAPDGTIGRSDVECPTLPPPEEVASMSGVEFFTRLSKLIEEQGPLLPGDEPILPLLASIGVGPLAEVAVEDLPAAQKALLNAAPLLALKAVETTFTRQGDEDSTGWSPDPSLPLGDYGTDYLLRALIAVVGFGANRPEFAVYQVAQTDAAEQPLTGEGVYTMTFPPGGQPPVEGFWSLTVYNEAGFLAANPIDRFALGSNSALVEEADGSLVLTLSHEPPSEGPLENWLPIPLGPFGLTIRMFGPTEAVLTNEFTPPRPELQ